MLLQLFNHLQDFLGAMNSGTRRQLENVASTLENALLEWFNPLPGPPVLTEQQMKFPARLVQENVEWWRDLGNYQRGGGA
jgi:hypothetical protein